MSVGAAAGGGGRLLASENNARPRSCSILLLSALPNPSKSSDTRESAAGDDLLTLPDLLELPEEEELPILEKEEESGDERRELRTLLPRANGADAEEVGTASNPTLVFPPLHWKFLRIVTPGLVPFTKLRMCVSSSCLLLRFLGFLALVFAPP